MFQHRILGVQEREEEVQEFENLFEKNNEGKLPNLVKKIDFQEVQEAQRVLKKLEPRRNTLRHIIISFSLSVFGIHCLHSSFPLLLPVSQVS